MTNTVTEVDGWVRTIDYKAIHRSVLIIAATRRDDTWKAYVHVVGGQSHEQEAKEAYEKGDGSQLLESQARAFFSRPPFDKMKYAK